MASASPVAQSIVLSSIEAARRWSCGSRRGCTVSQSGRLTCEAAIRLTISAEMPVWMLTGKSATGRPVSAGAGAVVASRTSAKTFSSWPWKSWSACSASSMVMSPRPISASVYSLRTERFLSIRSYISGWVNDGLSASL